ncbi:MAG: PhoB family transcriptional regulator [delta proteobacterium ML8_F1]|nr:MAG: PhoB family transcriptional regulator [delta proteobacterium ML8_F1]
MYKIMIVEDDLSLANELTEHLKKWDYQIFSVQDFKNINEQFVNLQPHLVLLDINLPYYDGYYWCHAIRRLSRVPIIFISSISDNMNMIMAINMGGDDFVIKPFNIDLLVSRIQALLRRSYSYLEELDVIEHRGVVLSLSRSTLDYNGKTLDLTRNEYRILRLLFTNIGRVLSRDTIITSLWEDESFIDDNTLTVNVTRLRKKLESIGLLDFIRTKKGMGYFID